MHDQKIRRGLSGHGSNGRSRRRVAIPCAELLESRVLLSGLTGSDIAGTWVFAGSAQGGTIAFNDSGGVTGGSLTTSAGQTVTPSGSYVLDANGNLSVDLDNATQSGAMNTRHDVIAITQTSAINTLAVLVSTGGASFGTADLTGTWTVAFDNSADAHSGGGTVKFDGGGKIIGGSITTGMGTNAVTGGTYTVGADGSCSVTILVSGGSFSFTGGLNASKDVLALSAANLQTANETGKPNLSLLVRSAGGYSDASLTGGWTINTELGVGTLDFSGAGLIDTSTFTNYQGHAISVSGTYSVSSSGTISMKIRSDDNGTIANSSLTGAMSSSDNVVILDSALDTPFGNVAALVSGGDHAPTLTGMGSFGTAVGNLPFTISYSQLVSSAAGLGDIDGDTVDFQVDSGAAGAVFAVDGITQNSFPFDVGPGQTLSFTPAATASGKITAFTVSAFDGTLASAKPVAVVVTTIPEPVVSVTTQAATADEVNNGVKGIGGITFARSGSTTLPLTVTYSVSGAANDGSNYQTLSLSAVIPAGKPSVVVPVIPIDNLARSGNITVTLTAIASAPNYTLSTKTSGTVTIVDNNLAPLSIAGMSLSEKTSSAVAPTGQTGAYQLFFAATGSQYILFGGPTVASAMGTYSYDRTSATTATVDLTDTAGTTAGTLTFSSATAAVYAFMEAGGQTSVGNKLTLVAAPKTNFAPASVGGHVDTHKITSGTGILSKSGSDETIFSESSDKLVTVGTAPVPSALNHYTYEKFGPNLALVMFTNAASENGFTAVLYSSATKGAYVTTLDGAEGTQHGSFTVVPQPATAIAPESLSGMTLTDTIKGGEVPFAVKGTSTFVLAATSYSFTQTTPAASSTGTYTYEVLTPGIGYILFDDSLLGTGSEALSFSSATKATYVLAKGGSLAWESGSVLLS